jgi:YhgE/Pip-like protein
MDDPVSPDTPRSEKQPDPYQVRARHLLKVRALWAIHVIVGSVVIVLITGFYIGSVVDPLAHLHGLPVSIVNEDAGATIGGRQVDFGAQLQSGLTGSRTVSRLLSLTPEPISAAEGRMNRNGSYATLVIPPDFTASLLALTGLPPRAGTPPGKPTTQLLANMRAGTVGVSLASGVLEPAIARASRQIGQQLLAATRLARTAPPASTDGCRPLLGVDRPSHRRVSLLWPSHLRGRQPEVTGVVLRRWLPRPHPCRLARPSRRSG